MRQRGSHGDAFSIDRILEPGSNLIVERQDGYLWIRLNRPDKANALSVSLMEGATAALAQAAGDERVRAILLTGVGERVFSAGADVREQPADGDMAAHRKRRSAGLAAFLDAIMDSEALKVAASLAEKNAKTFAANKRWLNRSMKAALAEARAEHEEYRKLQGS